VAAQGSVPVGPLVTAQERERIGSAARAATATHHLDHRTANTRPQACAPAIPSCDPGRPMKRITKSLRGCAAVAGLVLSLAGPAGASGSSAASVPRSAQANAALGNTPQHVTRQSTVWLTTRTQAQWDLRHRFRNIARVSCSPDRSSATQVFGNHRSWQRFGCGGRTYDRVSFSLLYRTTGQCADCWTITNLRGDGANHLRVRHRAPTTSPTGASCPSDHYRNSSGHCVRRPSPDPTGATALCYDGTYSYSEHASGTCSHHGGVARWINHP
jgi:hypothetical protein